MSDRECRADPADQSHADDRISAHDVKASEATGSAAGLIVVDDGNALQRVLGHLLDVGRVAPAVGLATETEQELPVIPPAAVRAVVGVEPLIFLVAGEVWLEMLAHALGPLSLHAETARIWWPELTITSDVRDHPTIQVLEAEDPSMTLGEFARVFQITEPMVSRELRVLEDLLALTQYELAGAREHITKSEERIRDAHRERHREALRAEQHRGQGS
jgi:hypothetical protein